MNILLTGSSGFVGSYVNQILPCTPLADEKGTIDIRDIKRIKSFLSSNIKSNVKSNIASNNIESNITSNITSDTITASENSPLNINSSTNTTSNEITTTNMPYNFNAVIHLAAQSFVPESFNNPLETFDINFTGTYNLFSALKEYGFHGKVLYISSGDIYGLVSEDKLPIKEDYPLKPRNPYAVSKVACEALCYQWSITENMEIVIARPFNHIGPNQNERFVVPSFAKQIVEIELGLRKPVITAGNIDTTRDFLDVRDVANAYKLLLEKGVKSNGAAADAKTGGGFTAEAGFGAAANAYNVCSGTETSIRSIINMMFEITGVDAKIEIDSNKLRPNEQKRVYASDDKIKKITGWEPKIRIKQSLTDILNYWKEALINNKDIN